MAVNVATLCVSSSLASTEREEEVVHLRAFWQLVPRRRLIAAEEREIELHHVITELVKVRWYAVEVGHAAVAPPLLLEPEGFRLVAVVVEQQRSRQRGSYTHD